MHLLIFDFMARWWWIFVLIFLFAVVGASFGALLILTPLILAPMMIEQQHGWARVVNGVPLTRRSLATAWWSIGVLIPTLLALFGLLVGGLIFHLTRGSQLIPLPHPPSYTLTLLAPFQAVIVGIGLGLGYAALCFLLTFVIPKRLPPTPVGKLALVCLGMMVPLIQFGPVFMSMVVPRNLETMLTWHWVAFGLVPIMAWLSWVTAPSMPTIPNPERFSSNQNPRTQSAPKHFKALTGMSLFVADCLKFNVLVVPLGILIYAGSQMLLEADAEFTSFLPEASVAMFIIGCFINPIRHDLRILRSLPFSTSRLALLRLLGPIICGFCHAVVVTMLCRYEFPSVPPTLLFFTLFFSLSGGCALAIACWSQFATWKWVLVGLASIVLSSLGISVYHPQVALVAFPTGAAALLISFHLFKRGLRQSESYQKLRGIPATEATT